jgi:hypothetical protein
MKSPNRTSFAALAAAFLLSFPIARADDGPQSPPPAPPAEGGNGDNPPPAPPPGANDQPPPRHRGHRQQWVLAELTQKLGLSADQQKTVGEIIASSRAQAKELQGDESLSQDDRRAKMSEIARSTRASIRAALTPDQQKVFDALPERGRGRPGAAPSPTPTPAGQT